jgi:hypothetical protein
VDYCCAPISVRAYPPAGTGLPAQFETITQQRALEFSGRSVAQKLVERRH